MRISRYQDDPGFHRLDQIDNERYGVWVFVDGNEIRYWNIADEELGLVVKDKLNEKGEPFVDADDNWALEQLNGKVEIRIEKRTSGL